MRVERLSAHKYPFDYVRATAVITEYYTSASSLSDSASASLDFALSLPKGPLVCLSVLIPYLQAFHLNSAFLLSSNFRPFNNASYMLLNNSALYNLDILACSQPASSAASLSAAAARRGSLLWLLDHTKTSFGSRLMRHWTTHPLLSAPAINQRLDAVTELMDTSNEWVGGLAALLAGLPDLERGLSRIHYSTAKPKEFLLLLQAYQSIVDTLPLPSEVHSARLSHLLSSVDREEVGEVLLFFVSNLDAPALDAADKLAKSRYYTDPDLFPSLAERKQAITQGQQLMRTLLLDVRRLLGPAYSSLEYKSVLTSQYLIEVSHADVHRLPRDWLKVNSTKAKVRYHTPAIKDGWIALTRAEELLEEESDRCWALFLQRFASHYALFRALINVLSELDCLLSLATVSTSPGYVRPQLAEEERVLDVEGLRHPMSELSVSAYVPNDCRMSERGERLMLITGPNMGGPTTQTHTPTHTCFSRLRLRTSCCCSLTRVVLPPSECRQVELHPLRGAAGADGAGGRVRARHVCSPVCVRRHPHAHGRARLAPHRAQHVPDGAGRDAAHAAARHASLAAHLRRAGPRHVDARRRRHRRRLHGVGGRARARLHAARHALPVAGAARHSAPGGRERVPHVLPVRQHKAQGGG